MFQFVHTGKTSPKKGTRNTEWILTKNRGRIQNLNIQFISFLFLLNVNMLIVVKVLECIHASTVEHRLPQLRGWGVVVALGTPPCPHWAPARTDTSVSPNTSFYMRAILTPRLTEGHKWYLPLSLTPPDPPRPSCQTTLPAPSPLFCSLFWSTSLDMYLK